MHLRSAHIRHYKSLEDVTVAFATPITVIVGPNGAGKSNLVDCLRFVRDAVTAGLDQAVQRRGGIGRIRDAMAEKSLHDVSIRLEFLQELQPDVAAAARHGFALKSLGDGNYVITSEEARWNIPRTSLHKIFPSVDPSNAPSVDAEPSGFDRDVFGTIQMMDDHEDDPPSWKAPRSDRLALGMVTVDGELGEPLIHFETNWSFWSLYPDVLRQASFEQAGTRLNEDGSNWASVVHALAQSAEGAQVLERINECLRVILPNYQDIKVERLGTQLIPLFNFKDGNATKSFDAHQVSDGTLRVFGILLALYQQPSAGLLVIEEPEQSLHPGALAMLVESMREAAELTQIIVTTHSPQMIDHLKPEEIRVATMQDGHTRIASIAKNQVEAVKQGLMSLGEFMQAEGLQPDLEP